MPEWAIGVPGKGTLLENWFGRFAADCVGCTETLVAAPICEVTATEERHRLQEIPLAASSEERRALLDKINEWVDRARHAGNTQEATMREDATAWLPLLEKCFGGGTKLFGFDPLAPPGVR